MTLDARSQYAAYLLQLISQDMLKDSERWFGEEVANDPTVLILGIVGEAGEVADEFKKMLRGSQTEAVAWPKIMEECVDVFIYLMSLCALVNFNIIEGYDEKRAFNEQRFGKKEDADSPDQSTLAAEVRRQQQSPLGAAGFVSGSDLPPEVYEGQPEA